MKTTKIFSGIFFLIAFMFILFPTLFEQETKEEVKPKKYPDERFWLQKTYPYFDHDPEALVNAVKEAKSLRTEKKLLRKTNEGSWEFAGPLNIGGRITDIEFNPLNNNIVYAGAATGGILKSTDKGVTWTSVFDDESSLSIGDIGIDPVNPNIIYVGTGEANGGHNNFPGTGMFKSTDAGATWEHIGLENTASIGRVIVNPDNPQIVFIAAVGSYFKPNSDRGVYKSTDSGLTWENSLFISDSTGAIDIVMHPENPDTMFAAMWERVRRPMQAHLNGPESGIYRTFDGGENWELLDDSKGLPNSTTNTLGRIGLAISRSNPSTLYALYNDGANITGLYKTATLGDFWMPVDPNNELRSASSGFSWYFGQIRVDPNDPNIVFVKDVSFAKSTDGGYTWNQYNSNIHVDHHALAFDPTDSQFIINGNDGGINISTNSGLTWQSRAHIPVTQFYEIGLDYKNPDRLYGGTQDNGTIRRMTDNLDNWESIYGGDGFYVIVDYNDPNIIYVESQNGGLGKSTSGGGSFHSILTGINAGENSNWSTPVIMDPVNHLKLYYGTTKLYRTTNGGTNWLPISEDLVNDNANGMLGTVSTIAVAPTDTNYMYVGTDDGNVWATYDGGENWHHISEGKDLPYRWVTRVIADPVNKRTVYITYSGLRWVDPQPHIFKSTDRGTTWQNISNNLPDSPINAIAIDLRDNKIVYIGSDVGVYYSRNSGEEWMPLGKGIPIVPINDMKIHPTANYLAVGTHGRGIYKFDLNQITQIEEEHKLPTDFVLYQNYPNPFNPSTTIKYALKNSSNVILKVYDMLGREVKTLVHQKQSAGNYIVHFDASELSSGNYFYTLQSGKKKEVKKMTLIK